MLLHRKIPTGLSRMTMPGISALLILLSLGLTGCDQKQEEQGSAQSSLVLAKVNGEEITEDDLLFSMERTFSQMDMFSFDEDLRQKVLDSVIASRAMKQLALQELSEDQIKKIANLTRAYQEELYVKEYLQAHVTPTPVTPEMIKEYYETHPEEFGSVGIREYEILVAPANISDAMRDDLLGSVPEIRQAANWSSSAANWDERWGLRYQKARGKEGLLNKALEQQVNALDKGNTSNIFYIDGQLHLVRVINLVKTPPKSLAEVSGDIRQRLAPIMLREAVKNASQEAREKVQIEIVSQAD